MGVTLLMFLIAIITAASTGWVLINEKNVEGHVADLVVRFDEQGNNFYYPVISFVAADGSRKLVQTTEGSWPAAYAIDQKVSVAYNPQRPNEAHIQTRSSIMVMWLVPMITGGLGVAFLLATLLVRWINKTVPDSPDSNEEKNSL